MSSARDTFGDYVRGVASLFSVENLAANWRDVVGSFFIGAATIAAVVLPIAAKAVTGYAKEEGWIK